MKDFLAALGALSLTAAALFALHAWNTRNDPVPSECPGCGRAMDGDEDAHERQRRAAPEVAL